MRSWCGGMTGHAPILLLDEIAAHLDEGRRAALFDLIEALDWPGLHDRHGCRDVLKP